MLSLFIRNLIFTILQPGIVAGLLPYLIVKNKLDIIVENEFNWNNYAGIFIFVVGVLIALYCIYDFAVKGKGTLSPADKTKNLVISGLYKFSRNPMYVGILLILLGEVVYMKSLFLFLYAIIVFLGFHLFVRYIEEPRLKSDFGKEYIDYLLSVRRWI